MLRTPTDVQRDLKNRIAAAYEGAIPNVGKEEVAYVKSRIDRTLKRLASEPGGWLASMGATSEFLHRSMTKEEERPGSIGSVAYDEIVAALFYLCNPFDLIPDHHPSRGYLDDAYVINECLRRLKKSAPKLFAKADRLSSKVQPH